MRERRRRPALPESRFTVFALCVAVFIFAFVLAGTWQFSRLRSSLALQISLGRGAYAERDRLLQLVNEETGVRGYVATGNPAFLDIYYRSRKVAAADAATLRRTLPANSQLRILVSRSLSAEIPVQRHLANEIHLVAPGNLTEARHQLSPGKTLFDRLRVYDAAIQSAATTAVETQRRQTLLLTNIGLYGGYALCALSIITLAGFGLLLRQARSYRLRSLRDNLTGVANRRGAMAAIEAGIRREQPFALIFIDLDGFKQINDLYGHAGGDVVLRGVASRLQNELRHSDYVCRIGGDEFACVIAPPITRDEVRHIAERLQELIALPYHFPNGEYRVGCSIGISIYPHDGVTADALLSLADVAMYQAKAEGGGVR